MAVRNGFESISYLGANIWKILSQEKQELQYLLDLKLKLNQRVP